jgi:hypothetical protein
MRGTQPTRGPRHRCRGISLQGTGRRYEAVEQELSPAAGIKLMLGTCKQQAARGANEPLVAREVIRKVWPL